MQITIPENELVNYIKENFKKDDIIELSYNRIFLPGKIINIIPYDPLIIILQLQGELLNQTIEININKIKKELIEIRHTQNKKTKIITIK